MIKPFLFSIKSNIPNVAPSPLEKINNLLLFTKKDMLGVPKIVKNDPEIFQNSWSNKYYKSYLNTKITHDELETC